MDSEYFASIPLSNAMSLCLGGITGVEAAHAQDAGLPVDGFGYYLFLARGDALSEPVEVVAKIVSVSAAERLAALIGATR